MKLRLLAVVCALALGMFVPASTVAASAAPLYYLSLGDSLAAGTQPGHFSTTEGYTYQLYAHLRATMPTLEHVQLACPGETTTSLISGGLAYEWRNPRTPDGRCLYPRGSQLAEATSLLRAHRRFVTLVTTIIGMNYYDPLVVTWFSDPTSLPVEVARADVFNDLLEGIYAAAGDPVADVETAFAALDTTPVNGIPLDVARICAWTWMCAPAPVGPNIHANAAGYAVMAAAFEAKL
ncbi:MAG: SGNH/GDSL hydrolase family protein [Chloroflexi bacterium]|nr:MAG: SGNH/GDSL hydrolase family protein [Chloroflexota bacterium]